MKAAFVSAVAPCATPLARPARRVASKVDHTAEALAAAASRRTEMAGDRLPKRPATALALGLVPSTTSPTDLARFSIEVDRNASRARRMRKSIITGARLHAQEATQGGFRGRWAMVTLTYREGVDALPRHVSGILDCIGSYLRRSRYSWGRPRLRYVWALELTQRLRPHYHVLLWLPRGVSLPKPDKRGWWQHGLTRIEWARNAVGYLAKYASKFTAECAAALPKGLRIHACGGLNKESQRELRWWKSPTDAREALGVSADIRKTLGGYADKLTGVFWPSPWHVSISLDGRVFAWKETTV